ncbi:hypothetical protein KDM41_15535, partial [bacterium]|nr:hypothetical protein [bacterium]
GGAGGNGGVSCGLLMVGPRLPATDAACAFACGEPGRGGSAGPDGDGVVRAENGLDAWAAPRRELDDNVKGWRIEDR